MEVYYRLGMLYAAQRVWDRAYLCLERVAHANTTSVNQVDVLFHLGHVLLAQQNTSAALSVFNAVLQQRPNHPRVLVAMSQAFLQANDPDRALPFAIRASELATADSAPWLAIGRAYMAKQEHHRAYDAFQQGALQKVMVCMVGQRRRGRGHRRRFSFGCPLSEERKKNTDRAVCCFCFCCGAAVVAAISREQNDPFIWSAVGRLFMAKQQYNDALNALKRAISLDPNVPETWHDLGDLYQGTAEWCAMSAQGNGAEMTNFVCLCV